MEPHQNTPLHPPAGLAVTAYTGARGQAYHDRNRERLQEDAARRRTAIRGLVTPYLSHTGWYLWPWCEVGCGEGYNLFPGDVGVDVDPRALSHLSPQCIPVIGEATTLPFPPRWFTVVFCVGLLMHLPGGEWERTLQEMARISREVLLIGEYVGDQEREKENPHWKGLLWERPYTPPEGWVLRESIHGLSPFDPDVTFLLYTPSPLTS